MAAKKYEAKDRRPYWVIGRPEFDGEEVPIHGFVYRLDEDLNDGEEGSE